MIIHGMNLSSARGGDTMNIASVKKDITVKNSQSDTGRVEKVYKLENQLGNRINCREGINLEGSSIAVFWDIENCAPPKTMTGTSVRDMLVTELHKYGPIKQVSAYAELEKFPSKLRVELQRSGIHLIDTPKTRREKDVADHMIITDMFVFAMENSPPQTIVLISGDIDYAYSLATLRMRGYKVILIIPPVGAHRILREQTDVIYEWAEMMKAERETIDHEIASTVLKYEHLMSALDDLARNGVERPNISQIEEQLDSKYPDWSSSSGFNDTASYVADATENGWVGCTNSDGEKVYYVISGDAEEMEDIEDEERRYEPLLSVLRQAKKRGNPEPEMAQVGILLRSVMKNPLEQLGVSQLLEYVKEAEEAGLVSIRRDGLQYYVSIVEDDKTPVVTSKEDEGILNLLVSALASLRKDEMMPTGKAVIGRMRELHPGWNLFKSSMKDIPTLINRAKELRGIIVEARPPNYLIFPAEGKYEFVDTTDVKTDPFNENHWNALKGFLQENSDIAAQGRYGLAARLKKEKIPGLKKLSLGKLTLLVQLAINKGWLEIKWNTLSVSRLIRQ
jgi:uncharacterized LabA/DUF88 family protein